MTAAQRKTLDDVTASWAKCGYGKPKTYSAKDSKDILAVAEHKDKPTVAARINELGSAKVGKADAGGMGSPLKPLSPDHPNYELEQQYAANA